MSWAQLDEFKFRVFNPILESSVMYRVNNDECIIIL